MGKMDKVLEIFKSTSDKENMPRINEAFRILNKLRDKKTISEIEQKLINGDFSIDIRAEVIDKTVNVITTQIKQTKLSNELEAIILKVGENEYPFPPSVTISCGGESVELCSEFVRPKELHYEMEAISADYNLTYSNNSDIIIETYKEIVTKLQYFNWNGECIVSKGFQVNYTS
jgi:hypothetical protein